MDGTGQEKGRRAAGRAWAWERDIDGRCSSCTSACVIHLSTPTPNCVRKPPNLTGWSAGMQQTLGSFKPLSSAVETVYLIEASPPLREAQRKLLCGPESAFEPIENGDKCTSKYGHPIIWYEDFRFVPSSSTTTPFILAHEFFDALPIHAFTSTSSGWRELLVSHNPPTTTHLDLHTPRSQVLGAPVPEFSLTTATAPTPYSAILPELSERYKALKKHAGSTIEISPEALALVESIALRIGRSRSGAALIIDYGPADTIPVNSLRGIKAHRTVSPFLTPGEVDISADVDFTALVERALKTSDAVEVHGPVEQGAFLGMLGMKERMEVLVGTLAREGGGADIDKKKKVVESGYRRLVERSGGAMGKVYKAMAVVPEGGGRRPVGFGGGVVE